MAKTKPQRQARALQKRIEQDFGYRPSYVFCLDMAHKFRDEAIERAKQAGDITDEQALFELVRPLVKSR